MFSYLPCFGIIASVFHRQFLITYVFCVSQKFGACYIKGQWGRVQCKECYFMFTYTFVVVVFHQKNCFYHFHFSFWWSIKFPQQNIHQSETRIGDRKLWLELYVAQVSLTQWSILFFFDVPSLKLRNVIILPTDRPKIILPTAHITKN